MIFLAQLDTGITIVDKAAAASDRWLFLAALAIIIGGGVVCITWLVRSLEKKDSAHAATAQKLSEEHAAAFQRLNAEHAKERAEWKTAEVESKSAFTEALRLQRVDFREEIARERTATASMVDAVKSIAASVAGRPPA